MVPSRRQPKLASWLLWLFILLLITATSATFGAIFAAVKTLIAPVEPPLISKALDSIQLDDDSSTPFQSRLSRPVNLLVMGVDRVPEATPNSPELFHGRSDTILLLRLDPTDKSVTLLSIPRDTQVKLPEIGLTKISEANARGGSNLAMQTLTATLNNVPIERYVRVSSGAFRELVDLLGGVDVLVPYPMSYVDNTQQLKINLAQGWQTLNGEQADQFARFRNDGLGDLGRIQRQQALIQAIWNRLSNPTVLTRLPELIRVMQKYVDTNLNFEEILALANFSLQLDRDRLKMVMLPGRSSSEEGDRRSYWIVDEVRRDRVLSQYFKVGSSDFTSEGRSSNQSESLVRNLKIAVQNASGNPQAAKRLIAYLAEQGFSKVSVVEDWPDRQRQSQIIVQGGDLAGAEALKKALGGGKIEVAATGYLESDLTVRLGEDWAKKF